jgi:hypothetical protein
VPAPEPAPEPRPEEVRRRLDAVFGDVLPDTTADERDPQPPGSDAESDADAALLADRPPHHDRD